MQTAAVPGYRLRKARLSTRILTSLGLLGLFFGLLGAVALTVSRTGITPQAVRSYYLGEDETEAKSLEGLSGAMRAGSARPFAELAEVTHLHLMGGSLLLFLLCHLLSVCNVRDSLRTALYVISFSSFLITFLLPWLIVYGSAAFAAVFGPSIIIFICSLLFLILIPLNEMWRRREIG